MPRPIGKLGPAVGSQEWMQNEAKIMGDLVFADVEDFAFEARRELEWINEHMADIFERNHTYVHWQLGCLWLVLKLT